MFPAMATTRRPRAANGTSARLDRATYRPGDYGRVIRPDGTDQWWVRSPSGAWTALSHGRVVENDDRTITLLYLGEDAAD
jgi:hypothetical protein